MAWIKLTGKYQEFYLNMDGVRSFDREDSFDEWTRMHEYDKEEPIWVKETPEEIISLIREADYPRPLFVTTPHASYPSEVLDIHCLLRKDGDR